MACRLCSFSRPPPRLQSTLPTSPTISRHEYIGKMHFDLSMVALITTMFLAPMRAPRSYLQGGHDYARSHWLHGAFYDEANALTRTLGRKSSRLIATYGIRISLLMTRSAWRWYMLCARVVSGWAPGEMSAARD